MRRACWPASRRKETRSFTISILLPTLLYFIPSVTAELHRPIVERIRHHNIIN
jgi:hypothetical protein